MTTKEIVELPSDVQIFIDNGTIYLEYNASKYKLDETKVYPFNSFTEDEKTTLKKLSV